LPPPDRLAAAAEATGQQYVLLHADDHSVRLTRPGMRLDLGGIAKGYALDAALQEIRNVGLTIALVNASGDMVAGDPPPGKPGWRVGIAPLDPTAPPTVFGHLAHRAIATSGDAFQFVEIDGIRYSHIVDPRTGLGLTERSSVSVLAPDGMTADAMASAVCVLGSSRGLALVERTPHVEAMIVSPTSSGVATAQSPGFARWVQLVDQR
jgi:thiamine biosynthesis lipoprotein